MAEANRRGVDAVLAAGAELELRAPRPPLLARDAHERAHAAALDRLERVPLVDLEGVDAGAEEAGGVVARDPERRPRQVVGAEGEELGHARDPLGRERAAR